MDRNLSISKRLKDKSSLGSLQTLVYSSQRPKNKMIKLYQMKNQLQISEKNIKRSLEISKDRIDTHTIKCLSIDSKQTAKNFHDYISLAYNANKMYKNRIDLPITIDKSNIKISKKYEDNISNPKIDKFKKSIVYKCNNTLKNWFVDVYFNAPSM